MKLRILLVGLLAMSLVVVSCGPGEKEAEKEDMQARQLAIAQAVADSLVRVEYMLQYDKGEAPSGSGWSYRCPNCGNYHGISEEQTVVEERPLETSGFLLSPKKVITSDVMIHPRFIKSISVRYGDKVVAASPAGWSNDQVASFLDLAEPLAGAEPLEFVNEAKGPFYAVNHARQNGLWTTSVKGLGGPISVRQDGSKFMAAPSYCLIVDKEGRAVGISMKDELPVDDSWKGSPLGWDIIKQEEMAKLLKIAEEVSRQGILRVALSFRSPKKGESGGGFMYGDDEADNTERNVLGLLIEADRILVLTELKPKVTARLERMVVHTAEGRKIKAEFAGTLNDYGCLLGQLEEPLEGNVVTMSSAPIESFRSRALLSADIRLQGETRREYYGHKRIGDYKIGWKQNLYPGIAGDEEGCFVFDTEGLLVAFPVSRREKASTERNWYSGRSILTSAVSFSKVFSDLVKNSDPSNVPLTEEQENRLAWLGVELQPLNKELARANKVSDFSRDGQIGGLVSYVYPDSPAQEAGVEVGDILLRLHVEGLPKPLEVELSEGYGLGGDFPWSHFDQMPEEFFDRMPRPWPSAENRLSRAITDLGFGKKFVAEFFSEGQVLKKDLEVVQSPAHYDSAEKYKSEVLGLTVRNLTYEVRRYFHEKAEDPGVIVSKIEPGSKASVSGIKPYELLTHVNDQVVMNVDDFAKLIADQAELRLSVKRMTKGRVVRIALKAPTTEPEQEAGPE